MSEGDNVNQTAAINTTTTDQVEDPGKVISINRDKLLNVKNSMITDAFEELDGIATEREALNAKAEEIRNRFPKLGIPKKAFNMAYQRYTTPEDKRAALDAAFMKCISAADVGFQVDLFDFTKKEE